MKEIWDTWVRIMDSVLLTMQSEVLLIIYFVIGFFVFYYILHPIVRLLIALEWDSLMTYVLIIPLMFLTLSLIDYESSEQYVVYAMIIFSLLISFKRGFAVKRKLKQSQRT